MKKKEVELILDDMRMFYFFKEQVRRTKNGEFVCFFDGGANRLEDGPSVLPISVTFLSKMDNELFGVLERIDWGGWNRVPSGKVMDQKLECWAKNYGIELFRICHNRLWFRALHNLTSEEIDSFGEELMNCSVDDITLVEPGYDGLWLKLGARLTPKDRDEFEAYFEKFPHTEPGPYAPGFPVLFRSWLKAGCEFSIWWD